MRNFVVNTAEGQVVFTAENPKPNVLLFHGFKREANQLLHLRDLIPDLAFVHLPGHSKAPLLTEVTLATWIRAFREMMTVFPQPPLILAESLGAIVALSLPARAVIAVEPPLSVDQLWPLRRTIRNARARGLHGEPELEAMFETPFNWVLDRISSPTLLLAGSRPLLPERDTDREPSLLTDEDFATYARHPLVEAHRIPGGHTLLDHNPEGVMAAARPFMLKHGFLPAAGDV